MAFLVLFLILGAALWMGKKMQIDAGHALMLTVSAQTIFLFVFGLIGQLYIGYILILSTSAFLALFWLRDFFHNPGDASPPVSIGLPAILVIVFWAFYRDSQLVYYDEYAHWGIFLKDMLALDRFWDANTNAMHTRYPPGSTLWQYLFVRLDEYSDGKAYLAHFVLLITPLMTLFKNIKWTQFGWIVGVLAFLVLVISNYSHGIASLYVDHIIGVWFAGILISYLALKEKTIQNIICFVFPLALLAILKDSGLFFSIAAALIIGISEAGRQYFFSKKPRRDLLKTVPVVMLLISIPALSVVAWNSNRNLTGHPKDVVSAEGIAKGLTNNISDLDAAFQNEIAKRYKDVLFNQQLSRNAASLNYNEYSYNIRSAFKDRFRLTTFSFLGLWLILYLVVVRWLLSGSNRITWAVSSFGAYAAALIYIYILYLSYRFAFGVDGYKIPSYLRYVHTIVLPLFVLAICPLLPVLEENNGGAKRFFSMQKPKGAMFAFVLMILLLLEPPLYQSLKPHYLKTGTRDLFSSYSVEVKRIVGPNPVWIYLPQVFPNAADRLLMFLFSPTPVRIEDGIDYFENGDDVFLRTWSGQAYIWMPPFVHGYESRITHFIGSKKPSNNGLYRVVLLPGKKIDLVPVDFYIGGQGLNN